MHETRKKYTVLLLSAPIGSGHRLAAEALEQALADRPEVEVIHGNIFDFFPQFLGKVFLGTYLWILNAAPGFISWPTAGATSRAALYGCVSF